MQIRKGPKVVTLVEPGILNRIEPGVNEPAADNNHREQSKRMSREEYAECA